MEEEVVDDDDNGKRSMNFRPGQSSPGSGPASAPANISSMMMSIPAAASDRDARPAAAASAVAAAAADRQIPYQEASVAQEDTSTSTYTEEQTPLPLPPLGAPAFTPSDIKAELATVTIDEMINVEKDLRGVTDMLGDMGLAPGREQQGGGRAAGTDAGAGAIGTIGLAATAQLSSEVLADLTKRQNLLRLEEAVRVLPDVERMSYLNARRQCPDQISDDRKLLFLERENSDPSAAARRLCMYWKIRLDIFGPERCYRPMTLIEGGALHGEVTDMVRWCPVRILPRPDGAGRTVLFFHPARRDVERYSVERALMSIWYTMEVVCEDRASCRAGCVALLFGRDVTMGHNSPKLQRYLRTYFWDIFPTRVRSLHLCHPTPIFYYVLNPVARRLMGREMRLRYRVHYGTVGQVLNELEEYNLTRDVLPSDLGGNVILDLKTWIAARMDMERRTRAAAFASTVDIAVAIAEQQREIGPPSKKARAARVESNAGYYLGRSGGAAGVASPANTCSIDTFYSTIMASRSPLVSKPVGQAIYNATAAAASAEYSSFGPPPPPPPPPAPALTTSAPPPPRPPLTTSSRKKGRKHYGRKSDPRMKKAIELKVANPDMDLFDALVSGGYSFQGEGTDKDIVDEEGVTLRQRKNNLCRRLRFENNKNSDAQSKEKGKKASSPHLDSVDEEVKGHAGENGFEGTHSKVKKANRGKSKVTASLKQDEIISESAGDAAMNDEDDQDQYDKLLEMIEPIASMPQQQVENQRPSLGREEGLMASSAPGGNILSYPAAPTNGVSSLTAAAVSPELTCFARQGTQETFESSSDNGSVEHDLEGIEHDGGNGTVGRRDSFLDAICELPYFQDINKM